MYADQAEKDLARQNVLVALLGGWIKPALAREMLNRVGSTQTSVSRRQFTRSSRKHSGPSADR
jgi:hypothetical protein